MARDRTIHSDVVSDVASPQRVKRGEVLFGVERRRKWSDEMRLSIVAEALEPGAIVSHVARRHDLNPSQLFGWVKQYRIEAEALTEARRTPSAPMFAPVMVDTPPVLPTTESGTIETGPTEAGTIEIRSGTTTVRIRGAADAKTLSIVLKALRSLG